MSPSKHSMRRSAQNPSAAETAEDEREALPSVETEDLDDDASVASDGEPEDAADAEPTAVLETPVPKRRVDWSRVLAYGLLPAAALILALSAGVLKYVDNAVRDDQRAGSDAMAAAKATTVAMLSYTPETVDRKLRDVRSQLTGDFRNQYGQMADNVVIPGALSQQVTAETTVPAASVVSVEPRRVVVLLYVDQTVTVGVDQPTVTSSSARVTLDDVGGKWLISQFATI